MDGEDDIEGCGAGVRRVVGDGFGDGAALDVEVEWLFGEIGQAGEIGLAVAVSADLQISFAHIHETVAQLDGDFSIVDGLVCAVADGEVGGAGAHAAVDLWDGGSTLILSGLILRSLIVRIGAENGAADADKNRQTEDLQEPDADANHCE